MIISQVAAQSPYSIRLILIERVQPSFIAGVVVGTHRYKDATKTTFKSPTRLECMMQVATQSQTDISQSQTDMSQSQTDMSQSQTDNSQSQTDMSQSQTDMSQCQTDISRVSN